MDVRQRKFESGARKSLDAIASSGSFAPPWMKKLRTERSQSCPDRDLTWELPKIGDPKIVP